MSTAIIYRSMHGTTQKTVERLKKLLLDNNIDIIDYKKNRNLQLNNYDTIIIGGSIHAGKIQKDISKLIKNEENTLLSKNLGLFLCCMYEKEEAEKQFNDAFNEKVRKHAIAKALFGGEFLFERMNFIERAIVKKVAGVTSSISKLNNESIENFAEQINEFIG